jgi:hypothetical protein
MVKRRALLTFFVAATLVVSATAASAATRAWSPLPKTPSVTERITVMDGSMTSLLSFLEARLSIAYRTLRGAGIIDGPGAGTGYRLDGIQDGPDGMDPLGAKSGGIHSPSTASTRVWR